VGDKMKWNLYKLEALKTLNPKLSVSELVMNGGMGLIGEAGELVDVYKKALFQEHLVDVDNVKKELGDICWYIALFELTTGATVSEQKYEPTYDLTTYDLGLLAIELSRYTHKAYRGRRDSEEVTICLNHILTLVSTIGNAYHFSLDDIYSANIEKLAKRYAGQTFSGVSSRERNE
jgi:NTP pyrophosphatase (non-canonical NTP hydrolase)